MTKTYCDRCGKEGPVKLVALKSSDGRSDPLLERSWSTERMVDACEGCLTHLKREFGPASVARAVPA